MGTRPRERDGPGRALGPAKAPGTRSGATRAAHVDAGAGVALKRPAWLYFSGFVRVK